MTTAITTPDELGLSITEHIRLLQQKDAFIYSGEWFKRRPRHSNAETLRHQRASPNMSGWSKGVDRLLRFKDHLYILADAITRKEFFRSYHDTLTISHMGFSKTLCIIQNFYYWDFLRRKVKKYVFTYTIY